MKQLSCKLCHPGDLLMTLPIDTSTISATYFHWIKVRYIMHLNIFV